MKSHKQIVLSAGFALFICISGHLVQAQTPDGGGGAAPGGSEYGVQLGTLLPNSIDNVTEILPFWALSYGYPMSFGVTEASFAKSHAEGTDFDLFSLGVRGDVPLVAPDFNGFLDLGLNLNHYKPPTDDKYNSIIGFYVGTGVMAHVASNIWFRTDMRFSGNPGTSLYLGFGFVIRSSGGSGGS
jgi:hypothetical protein